MTEPAMTGPAMTGPGTATAPSRVPRPWRDAGLRLALAFITVALAAIALLAGLTAAFAAADVSTLASQQRAELANAIAFAAGAAWEENRTWSSADLSPVLDLATKTGAAVQIRARTDTSSRFRPPPPLLTGRSRALRSWSGASAWGPPWSGLPGPGSSPPTASCGLRCCGPSPGPQASRPCSRCSPGSPWPGG